MRLLKLLPWPGMFLWTSFDVSQARKAFRSLAATSLAWTAEDPHSRHLHLWVPAEVLPFRFMGWPQTGHLFIFIAGTSGKPTFSSALRVPTWGNVDFQTHILSVQKSRSNRLFGEKTGVDLGQRLKSDTHFVR